jgi:hypothetical protein
MLNENIKPSEKMFHSKVRNTIFYIGNGGSKITKMSERIY